MEQADSGQIAFYLERARDTGRQVVELGCGTGVISVAMALAGLEVRAYDPSASLITQALERRRALGIDAARCHFEQADLRGLRSSPAVGFVYAPNNALATLENPGDLSAVFATARAHLLPEGLFAFDLSQPGAPLSEGRTARSELELRAHAVRRPWLRRRTGEEPAMHRLRLLGLTSEEIEQSLAASGFVALERWGGFEGEPWEPASERLVVVSRLA